MTMDEETFLRKIISTKSRKRAKGTAAPPLGERRYLHSSSDLRNKLFLKEIVCFFLCPL